MIDKKAEEAKKAIDNTAGASAAEKQKAKDEVNYLNISILHKPLFYDFIRCPQSLKQGREKLCISVVSLSCFMFL